MGRLFGLEGLSLHRGECREFWSYLESNSAGRMEVLVEVGSSGLRQKLRGKAEYQVRGVRVREGEGRRKKEERVGLERLAAVRPARVCPGEKRFCCSLTFEKREVRPSPPALSRPTGEGGTGSRLGNRRSNQGGIRANPG
jgi:hypothetical protein